MSKHRQILRLYKGAMGLYPKSFREAYAEQILLTAQDALLDARTKSQTIQVIGRLTLDLCITAITENSKQLGGIMKRQIKTTKTSALSAAKLGVQIVGVGVVTFLVLSPIVHFFPVPQLAAGPAFLGLIASVVPLGLILMAYSMLRRAPRLPLWSKIVWAYGLGFGGAVCYFLFATNVDIVRQQVFSYTENMSILQTYQYDWIIIAVFLLGFYLAVAKFVQRFGVDSPAKTRTK